MNGDARSDAQLLVATANDDDVAFAVLVRRHIRAATLLAAQLLGDSDDAEDVVQEAFTVVHRNARGFDGERPFAPWFYAIVRRLAANRRERERRRAGLLALWHRDPSGRGADASAGRVEESVLAVVDAEAAARAIQDLSPMQRACFELVAVRGLSAEEVAAMHGISESTVRQHVFRARNALRERLEGKSAGDAHRVTSDD